MSSEMDHPSATDRDKTGTVATTSGRRPKPKGFLRLAFRSPVYIYRLHFGWLLGYRFLMVTHRGRKTGLIRQTVLEVIRHNPESGESIVVSAWGEEADWYRNIQASPALEIRTGSSRYTPIQRFLTPQETYLEFVDYERRNPHVARALISFIGFHYDGSESHGRSIAEFLRMVSFRPNLRA